jgi:hypothetical protein
MDKPVKDFPDECIAAGAKGKREARILKPGGKGKDFVAYGYYDIEAGKMLGKYSILLRLENNRIEHLFIVPAGAKEMVVKHAIEEKPQKRGIYDDKAKIVIYF